MNNIRETLIPTDIEEYLSGRSLYGDDFNEKELREWFCDETGAYAHIGQNVRANGCLDGEYEYARLNWFHGFRRLPPKRWQHVCSVGGADGAELRALDGAFVRATVVEPDTSGVTNRDRMTAVVPARPDGRLDISDCSVDLFLLFGVLHHIANVSLVIGELFRCAMPGGYLLVREPAVSMGDWRSPRPGLTKRERGIPTDWLRQCCLDAGFLIEHESRCVFPVLRRLGALARLHLYRTTVGTILDAALCKATAWNKTYDSRRIASKLQGSSTFLVLRKP